MLIKRLVLRQFRNIHNADINFTKSITVFVGDNGQGKTNIVESLVFLATGRSFRVKDDSYLIQRDKEVTTIEASLDSGKSLRVAISSKGKYMQVDRNVVKKMTDFIGHCNVILFAPDDIGFFKDTRKRRRTDVDLELAKISKDYMRILGEYSKLLSERNAILKQVSFDTIYLDLITESLIEKMIPIMKQRKSLVAALEPHVNKIYNYLTESNGEVKIAYMGPVIADGDDKNLLQEQFSSSFSRDVFMKATQTGVHRDDYIFTINGEPVANIASQGQLRSLMLAFKIALVMLVKEKTGSYPILCLDDLFSELDEVRRQRVFKLLPEAVQVIITTTDLGFIKTSRDVQIVSVKNGVISVDREVQYVNN